MKDEVEKGMASAFCKGLGAILQQLPIPVLGIGVLLVFRFCLLGAGPLVPEEAYYWLYTKHLDWCYLDHPAGVAWLIKAGTLLWGDTEFGVRIGAWLLSAWSSFLVYRLSCQWTDRKTALAACVLFTFTPAFSWMGSIVTPDVPLTFFWLSTLFCVQRATSTGALVWWLLAGVTTGLAFDSKYTAILLIPSALLYLAITPSGRRSLRGAGPWLALLLALLVAAPVLHWNAQHQWQSLLFQSARRFARHQSLSPSHTSEWLTIQLAVLSPLVLALFVLVLYKGIIRLRRHREGMWPFAICFSVPWLAVCAWQGLYSEVRPNWPTPAYLSLLPAAAVILRAATVARACRISPTAWKRVYLAGAGVLLAVNVIILTFLFGSGSHAFKPCSLQPWPELARQVQTEQDRLAGQSAAQPAIFVPGTYHVAAEMAFYTGHPDQIVNVHASFSLWCAWENFVGRSAIVILREASPDKLEVLRACFRRVDVPRQFSSVNFWTDCRQLWFVACHDYNGNPALGSL